MSDGEYSPESERPEVDESTGDAALDERLSAPVFTGQGGLDKAQVGISAFLILFVGGIAFFNARGIPLHYADQQAIVENEGLHRVFTMSDGWDAYAMRPIAALSVALDWQLSGGSARYFHIISVLIHLFNGVLVYLLCRRLIQKAQPEAIAMVGGMLFVVHPAVTQSVNTIANRSVLLATFFVLLSLVLYLRATSDKDNPNVMGLGGSLFCFALAWGSHVMAWVLPLLLFLVDLAARRDVGARGRAVTQTPYWVVLMLLLIVYASSGALGEGDAPSFSEAMGQVSSFYLYLPAMVSPGQLSAAHPLVEASGLPVVWAVSVVAAIVVLRFLPVVGLSFLWMLVSVVASCFFIVDASLSEERLYLPLAGAVLLAPWLLNQLPKTGLRPLAGGVAAVLIITLGTLTFFRNQVWQSEDGLWSAAAVACSDCGEPQARLGVMHLGLGDGLLELAQAAALQNNSEQFNMRRQEALAEFGVAEGFLTVAVQEPNASLEWWRALGKARRYLGNFEASRTACLRGLAIDPEDYGCTLELALLYNDKAMTGRLPADRQSALDYFRRARRLGPLPKSASLGYSALLSSTGDIVSARGVLLAAAGGERDAQIEQLVAQIEVKQRAVLALQSRTAELERANPLDPELMAVRAMQLFIQEDFLGTAYLVEQAFREREPDLNLWTVLGMSKGRIGALGGFLREWETPPSREGVDSPWLHLVRTAAGTSLWDMALAVAHHANAIGSLNKEPLVEMGDIARSLNNTQRAGGYFQAAAQQSPTDPTPVLRLADMAIAAGQTQGIGALLTEAQGRGAPASDIDALRERAGLEKTDVKAPVRTIIR